MNVFKRQYGTSECSGGLLYCWCLWIGYDSDDSFLVQTCWRILATWSVCHRSSSSRILASLTFTRDALTLLHIRGIILDRCSVTYCNWLRFMLYQQLREILAYPGFKNGAGLNYEVVELSRSLCGFHALKFSSTWTLSKLLLFSSFNYFRRYSAYLRTVDTRSVKKKLKMQWSLGLNLCKLSGYAYDVKQNGTEN